MKQINRWFLILVLLFGITLAACNSAAEPEEPAPATTDDDDDGDRAEEEAEAVDETEDTSEDEAESAEEVEEPVETEDTEETTDEESTEETAVTEAIADNEAVDNEESSEEGGGLFSGLFPQSLSVEETVQEFDTLNSYELRMNFSTTIGDVSQLVEAIVVVSNDPPQTQMTFSFSGFDELVGLESMSMTQLDGVSYMDMADLGCVTTSEGEMMDEDFGVFDANQVLGNVGEAQLIGEETINGIETLHYTFDETTLQDDLSEFEWAEGDVYIAKEGNYVVRFHLEGEGDATALGALIEEESAEDTQLAFMEVDMELLSINEPVAITIPEACEEGGLANSEYPVLDDAYESSSFGGILTYKTETAFADAVAFYQDAFSAGGWTYVENESFIAEGSTALMYFDKDDRSLTVTITTETGTEALLVVVFEE